MCSYNGCDATAQTHTLWDTHTHVYRLQQHVKVITHFFRCCCRCYVPMHRYTHFFVRLRWIRYALLFGHSFIYPTTCVHSIVATAKVTFIPHFLFLPFDSAKWENLLLLLPNAYKTFKIDSYLGEKYYSKFLSRTASYSKPKTIRDRTRVRWCERSDFSTDFTLFFSVYCIVTVFAFCSTYIQCESLYTCG